MSVPIISVAQMREWEQATWAAGTTAPEVIRQVGARVAQRVTSLVREEETVLLLAGKGHNGADVRAAREQLPGRRILWLDVTSPGADLPRLEAALAQQPAWIVDGLFGIGLNRPLNADWCRFINRLNAAAVPVLAVDVPSGLDADTGKPAGAAIRAALTLTVGAPKQGLLRAEAGDYVGRLEVAAEVGLIPCPYRAELQWTLSRDFSNFPPPRPVDGHKGMFGHLLVVAGSAGYHGAAVLATRGAQRAQPGLVTLWTQPDVYVPVASQLQAAMVRTGRVAELKPGHFTAVLVGPGLAAPTVPEEIIALVRRWWRELPVPLIVDASALDWLEGTPPPTGAVRVLTPHPGEAARLLKCPRDQVQQDRVGAVRQLARHHGRAWVVLKGRQTLIGRDTGTIFVNSSGNPHLAQGGAGDVLAGFLAGLLAQPERQRDVERAIGCAVWQHGAAADLLAAQRRNWVIEELAATIGAAH
ncbi:MAG TPA: NAD(P)H-hydrate dehydratase [Verrucomicrobiota bacterium]|nr:NAD(P)H-hydrate dehydratase [Verrucomicrobiota bacterium]HNT13229.1 NAD(P)H-hydrate dehydratase [Verrucomicrobiota bacterium]